VGSSNQMLIYTIQFTEKFQNLLFLFLISSLIKDPKQILNLFRTILSMYSKNICHTDVHLLR
jgi:hypothetical protein